MIGKLITDLKSPLHHMYEPAVNKMVIFDLDNMLLQDKFIEACARHYNFRQALALVRQIDKDPLSLLRREAAFLRNRTRRELMDLAASIAMVPDTKEVVAELKQRGYRVGIISDTYQFVTQLVARKIGADFELSYELVFIAESCTGELMIPSYFLYGKGSSCKHPVCKTNALHYICREHKTRPEDCIVVAGNENNVCMVKHAGLGVSFKSTDALMKAVARKHLEERMLRGLLKFAV